MKEVEWVAELQDAVIRDLVGAIKPPSGRDNDGNLELNDDTREMAVAVYERLVERCRVTDTAFTDDAFPPTRGSIGAKDETCVCLPVQLDATPAAGGGYADGGGATRASVVSLEVPVLWRRPHDRRGVRTDRSRPTGNGR